MFGYQSNQISMSNTVVIFMTKYQVSVNVCLKITDILSECGGYSWSSKYMVPYIHVSVALFLKRYILLKGLFVESFSTIIMKKKSINFLMKSVETPQHFSFCHYSFSMFLQDYMTYWEQSISF